TVAITIDQIVVDLIRGAIGDDDAAPALLSVDNVAGNDVVAAVGGRACRCRAGIDVDAVAAVIVDPIAGKRVVVGLGINRVVEVGGPAVVVNRAVNYLVVIDGGRRRALADEHALAVGIVSHLTAGQLNVTGVSGRVGVGDLDVRASRAQVSAVDDQI